MATSQDRPFIRRNGFRDKVVVLSSHGTARRNVVFKPSKTVNEVDLLKQPAKSNSSTSGFPGVVQESVSISCSPPRKDLPPIQPAIRMNQNFSIFTEIRSSNRFVDNAVMRPREKLLQSTEKIKGSSGKGSVDSPGSILLTSFQMLEINNQNDSADLTNSQVNLESKKSRRYQKTNCEPEKVKHRKSKERRQQPKSQQNDLTQSNSCTRTPQNSMKCLPNGHIYNTSQLGKNGSPIHLSPRMRSLQSFFEKKRLAAEAWKAKILYENKERTSRDLQWAARQLRTFSTNNRLNSVTPGKGNCLRLMSDMAGAEYGDSARPNVMLKPKRAKNEKEKNIVYGVGSFYLEEVPPGDKVTPEAQEILLVLRDTVAIIINDIITIDQGLTKRNFKPCFSIVEHLEMIPEMLIALIDHLYYTPQEFELVAVAKNINSLITDVLKDPVIVLFKMIELGHYLYYLGRILGEKIVPKDLPRLLHSIQVKLQRIKIGFVVRQYFHVPISMDFVITPYNKDRQLIRLEEECHCIVNLLHPEDPRSRYCPPSYRTIEVLYDEELGHFEKFQHRLNRILSPQRCTARLVSTILRQFDGREVVVTAEHATYLLHSDHRPRYDDVRALVVSGCRPRADRLPINL
ncbi:conserved hypothetical protein [Echinococcus multilocularis]|uniref:Uncharacterized protein n=1 Tax=Echinococcus multilocularis TaxID=6211 RepID=A0A068Y5M4_ECHMU|nr:conserved hypothetical protein [Echinococcus multilocularis]